MNDLNENPDSASPGLLPELVQSIGSTLWDVLPIAVVVLFFQLAILRCPIRNPGRLLWGMLFVILGLAFFLVGLNRALFPLGEDMARQLTDPNFLRSSIRVDAAPGSNPVNWTAFYWTYLFAFSIGVSSALAEPALIAVTGKAQEVSGGTVNALGLRLAVAFGVGIGVALGTFRIVMGHSLPTYIISAYLLVLTLTFFSPKSIVPLAYDSGGVTTSTVTVPLVAALGLGLSSQIPDRSPLLDGFGLIAFACLFPIISVLSYSLIVERINRFRKSRRSDSD
jgi:hypothetical protein